MHGNGSGSDVNVGKGNNSEHLSTCMVKVVAVKIAALDIVEIVTEIVCILKS